MMTLNNVIVSFDFVFHYWLVPFAWDVRRGPGAPGRDCTEAPGPD